MFALFIVNIDRRFSLIGLLFHPSVLYSIFEDTMLSLSVGWHFDISICWLHTSLDGKCARSAIMAIVLNNISFQSVYLHIMTSIECFLLISLSSQLSKILIIYAEILHLPTKNVKQTIVGIITCKSIFVFCLLFYAGDCLGLVFLSGSVDSFPLFSNCIAFMIGLSFVSAFFGIHL